jgi:hypothetical protein
MAICDGCGREAGAEHIRARIERLELGTRYRPVHIQTLLVGDAPPEQAEDYFYASEKEGAELQRSGIFLVYAVECPLAGGDASEAVRKSADNVLKRVRFSYKPKSIVLFGAATCELIVPLREAGFGEQLILSEGKPFTELPDLAKMRATSGL